MNSKNMLVRMLFLDGLLSLGGICAATILFLVGLYQQQTIVEQLYDHPFTVTNAALDLKMEILTLRNRMLELGIDGRPVREVQSAVNLLRQRIAFDLETIHTSYLGDFAQVKRMEEVIATWNGEQDQTFLDMDGGQFDAARYRISHGAELHVGDLLSNCDSVISYARHKAASFVADSKASYQRDQRFIVVAALLLASAYLLILIKRGRVKRDLFEQLHNRAIYDDLTGAHNRKSFIDLAAHEIERARRLKTDLSLIMIDIDHFKRINDNHGHASGDAVLRTFGVRCQGCLRKIDTLGRVGGEEFAVLLPGADNQEALAIAERIRKMTEQSKFQAPSGNLQVTVSAGVAQMGSDSVSVDQLMMNADAALYQAKHGGRNNVVVAGGIQVVDAQMARLSA